MFLNPKKIVEQAGVHSGQNIADLGSGSGFYVIEIAKSLMSTGTVYAIDVDKELLQKITNSAKNNNLLNVETIVGDFEVVNGTKLASNSIDICFVCNVFFQVENKKNAIEEIKRILIGGGKVVFIDWSSDFVGVGPKKEYLFTEEQAIDLFSKNGFSKEKNIMAGTHHYGIIFKKL